MRPSSFLSILGVLLLTGVAWAHKVGADAYVVEDGKTIQVEAWLSGGEIPKKGTVLVIGEDGKEVTKGNLNEGVFRFRPQEAERFLFVVSLGEGHMKKFSLSDKQLAKLRPGGESGAVPPHSSAGPVSAPSPARRAAADESRTLDRAVLGLILILAATVLAVVVQMNKCLQRVEQIVRKGREDSLGDSSP